MEHIWGDWILRGGYAHRTKNSHHINHVDIYKPGQPNSSRIKRHAGDPLGKKLRIVCGKCNNEWMSRIQEKAKPVLIPLFKGEQCMLDQAKQELIVNWAVMATMTAEFMSLDTTSVAVSQRDRDFIRTNEKAPPDWRVWIGYYDRRTWEGQWVHTTVPILEPEEIADSKVATPNTQSTSFIIGKLYVHTMSAHNPDHTMVWNWNRDWRALLRLVSLWPLEEQYIFWPINSLTDRDAEKFSVMFFRTVEVISNELGA